MQSTKNPEQQKNNFYAALAMKESSNIHTKIHPDLNYLGLYQFGEMALADIGYYKKESVNGEEIKYKNHWDGTWTGKNGIKSKDDFLNNRLVQDIAIREYHKKIWDQYLKTHHHHQNPKLLG